MLDKKFYLIAAIFAAGSVFFSPDCISESLAVKVKENPLGKVVLWAYQTHKQDEGDNIKKLADSKYDLLVIDQTRSIKGREKYGSKKDVSFLKKSKGLSGSNKIILCRVNAGAAENNRWYWQPGWVVGNPEWITEADNEPAGNYTVKFWRKEWKDILKKYIGMAIEDGYDGIYFDCLKSYNSDVAERSARAEGLDIKQELIKFAGELCGYAFSKKPGFVIVSQNAADMSDSPAYIENFDAILQESVWFCSYGSDTQGDVPVDLTKAKEAMSNLRKWQKLGKPIFVVEYASKAENVRRAYAIGNLNKFKTYVTLKSLDSLTQTPSPKYK